MTTLSARALTILREWVQSESLRKHCYAVADSMKHFAQLRSEDVDLWEAVGLLHDMDYERHPNLEHSPTEGHPFVGVKWLREHGWSEEICRAILSHADYSGVSRETPLEKTLYAVDELSGFVIAVGCYVKPLHKLAVDTAKSIGTVAVDLVGSCKIPFAPDQIKKFEARSAIGKKRKSPKC